MQYYCSIALNF